MARNLAEMPLSEIKGISSAREKLFSKLDIHNISDLFNHYPVSYQNRGVIKELFEVAHGECVSLVLEITTPLTSARIKSKSSGRPLTVQHMTASDSTGSIKITFFNREFLKDTFKTGRKFRFYGTVSKLPKGITMISPEFELYDGNAELPAFVPVYPLTAGISQKLISGAVKRALAMFGDEISENMTDDFLAKNDFIHLRDAIRLIHFPESVADVDAARKRLAFNELYQFFLGTIRLGKKERTGRAFRIKYPDMKAFTGKLPFTLTLAQKKAIQDILIDISTVRDPDSERFCNDVYTFPARRLIQGDVGSGKTMVACAAIYACAKSGFQAALMAPTGILARQHHEELSGILANFGIKCVLMTGGMRISEKKAAVEAIATGEATVVVGTHAIIEDSVVFKKLALVITDEQHRFGVMQRKALEDKSVSGVKPHVIVMSATPIPRTLALVMYCDLDVSIIDMLPKGRKPVETYAVGNDKRNRVYKFIAELVSVGRQAYIVCPLAEKDDELMLENNLEDVSAFTGGSLELQSAKEYLDTLKKTPLSEFRCEYIHGKMKQAEKDEIMTRFSAGEIDVLVSTTVIEVGVNVPNAAVMLIENAERFGLSQLHQLRGRVGRGSDKAFCILMSPLMGKSSESSDFSKRINVICKNNSGFVIAEKDLELRGPGEFFGKRQSGDFRFAIANISSDMHLVTLARETAASMAESDGN